MRLNEFQKRFKDLMLDHPDALDKPPEDLAAFCATGDIALPERLKVYRHNIIGSLTDLMLSSFPLIENLVGKEFLEGMARTFILTNPPNMGCLSFYGEGFAEFIEGFAPAASLPYLPDVARFELTLNAAYYARDDDALSPEALASVAPEELGDTAFALRDSVHLLQSPYPLLAIREFCTAQASDGTLDLDQGGAPLMIYRPQLESQTVALNEDEYLMLNTLSEGRPLGEAVETVLNTYQGFDFQAFLQKHLALETFRTF